MAPRHEHITLYGWIKTRCSTDLQRALGLLSSIIVQVSLLFNSENRSLMMALPRFCSMTLLKAFCIFYSCCTCLLISETFLVLLCHTQRDIYESPGFSVLH